MTKVHHRTLRDPGDARLPAAPTSDEYFYHSGTPQEDGSVRMIPFTHELLSEDIGTSREIVTQYMNQFRKQGYLQYSRKGIVLHRDAFHNWLQKA